MRRFSNHEFFDFTGINAILPGGTVVYQHDLGHEPDVCYLEMKAGDARLTTPAADDKSVTFHNPGTLSNESKGLLEFWFSTVK